MDDRQRTPLPGLKAPERDDKVHQRRSLYFREIVSILEIAGSLGCDTGFLRFLGRMAVKTALKAPGRPWCPSGKPLSVNQRLLALVLATSMNQRSAAFPDPALAYHGWIRINITDVSITKLIATQNLSTLPPLQHAVLNRTSYSANLESLGDYRRNGRFRHCRDRILFFVRNRRIAFHRRKAPTRGRPDRTSHPSQPLRRAAGGTRSQCRAGVDSDRGGHACVLFTTALARKSP